MDVSTLLREIENKRQNAWWNYLICGLIGLAPIAMTLLQKFTIALLLLALWLLYYFLLARPDAKKFANTFRRGNLLTALSAQMEEVVYHGKAGIPREEILGDRLLPIREGSSCMTFHRVTGTAKGMELEISDASFQLKNPDPKARPQFLSGCWVRIRLDHSTGQRARLVSQGVASPALLSPWFETEANLSPVPPEGRRSETAFFAWGPEGRLDLSDSVLDHLMTLWGEKELSMAVGLEGDRLSFFLPRRFIAPGAPPIRDPVSEELLRRTPLPELDGILKIATTCRRMEQLPD